MKRRLANFTDEQREELRKRLLAHKERYQLSPQKISDQIAEKTGFPAADEGGRKRVDRFLKATHKQPENFVAAVAEYLNQVAPKDVEESAIAIARFLAQDYDRSADLSPLIGRYQAYLRPTRSAPPPPLPMGFGTVAFQEKPRGNFETAYAVIEMTALEKSNALLIADSVSNIAIDPDIDTFPTNPIGLSNTGVLVPFGVLGFLIVSRSLMETRLYRLIKIADDPLTLRGHLTLNGIQAGLKRRRDIQVYDPDYEVELVRVADIGQH